MPKNIKKYYNFHYIKFKRKNNKGIKLVLILLVFILIAIFNNTGLLLPIINNGTLCISAKSYYALSCLNTLNNTTLLNSLNAGCYEYQDKTIINVYLSKQQCQNVCKNLIESGINCTVLELKLNDIKLNKGISKSNFLTVKNVIKTYFNLIDDLLIFAEEIDTTGKNLDSLKNELINCINIIENLINKIENLEHFNVKGKINLLLINSKNIFNNLLNLLTQENYSGALKTCNIGLILNFKNIFLEKQ